MGLFFSLCQKWQYVVNTWNSVCAISISLKPYLQIQIKLACPAPWLDFEVMHMISCQLGSSLTQFLVQFSFYISRFCYARLALITVTKIIRLYRFTCNDLTLFKTEFVPRWKQWRYERFSDSNLFIAYKLFVRAITISILKFIFILWNIISLSNKMSCCCWWLCKHFRI